MRSEFEFIKSVRQRFDVPKIGDDCAVLPKDALCDLVVSSDLLVEDVDFRRDWTIPEFLGHKALAVSLSDVAAMGARPVWAILSIGVPADIWNSDFIDRFYDGWFALAGRFGVELVGGDVSKTPDRLVIDSIAAGECAKGRAVLRSGAHAGDQIFVTGELGGAAFGLKLLESGERFDRALEDSAHQKLIFRHLRPTPRTEIGRTLGEQYAPSAMIDLSDGLAGDLAHICRESRVGARVFADNIPLNKDLAELAREQALKIALGGGEDFELLFTVGPADAGKFFEIGGCDSVKFSHIGEITGSAEEIEVVSADGTPVEMPGGFAHF